VLVKDRIRDHPKGEVMRERYAVHILSITHTLEEDRRSLAFYAP
jgi:hypothetical protein